MRFLLFHFNTNTALVRRQQRKASSLYVAHTWEVTKHSRNPGNFSLGHHFHLLQQMFVCPQTPRLWTAVWGLSTLLSFITQTPLEISPVVTEVWKICQEQSYSDLQAFSQSPNNLSFPIKIYILSWTNTFM